MKAAIIIPTNNPTLFKKYILSSLKYVEEIYDFTEWNILFQPPYTSSDIAEILQTFSDLWLKVNHDFYEPPVEPISILDLRSRCADMSPDVDLYLSLDDDMRFSPGTNKYQRSSGERYLEALIYCYRHERCGGLDCRGFLGGTGWGCDIRPVWNWCPSMASGMVFKNMKKHGFHLTPDYDEGKPRSLLGGWDEVLNVVVRVELGYYWAVQRNNPTYHKTGTNEIGYHNPADHWQNKSVVDANVRKWIRDRYDAPDWEHSADHKKCPVHWMTYLQAGGPDFRDPRVYDQLWYKAD